MQLYLIQTTTTT